jgi:hypothetical protein
MARDPAMAARILGEPLGGLVRRLRNAVRAKQSGSGPIPAKLPYFVIGDPDVGA